MGEMGFAHAGRAVDHDILVLFHELAGGEVEGLRLVQSRSGAGSKLSRVLPGSTAQRRNRRQRACWAHRSTSSWSSRGATPRRRCGSPPLGGCAPLAWTPGATPGPDRCLPLADGQRSNSYGVSGKLTIEWSHFIISVFNRLRYSSGASSPSVCQSTRRDSGGLLSHFSSANSARHVTLSPIAMATGLSEFLTFPGSHCGSVRTDSGLTVVEPILLNK